MASKGPLLLLHGLFMGPWIMKVLGRRLARLGWRPIYFSYASTRHSVRSNGERLAEFLTKNNLETAHLLGHSLGGLVLRHCLALKPDLSGKIMTLATPHRGSLVARQLRPLVGAAWNEGLDGQVPPFPRPFGQIVAVGGPGPGQLLRRLHPLNDGTVALPETLQANGLSLVLRGNHTAMLFHRTTAQAVANYLRGENFPLADAAATEKRLAALLEAGPLSFAQLRRQPQWEQLLTVAFNNPQRYRLGEQAIVPLTLLEP